MKQTNKMKNVKQKLYIYRMIESHHLSKLNVGDIKNYIYEIFEGLIKLSSPFRNE